MINYLSELKPEALAGKKVLLRVDFNVPVNKQMEVGEDYRIKSHRETLDYLLAAGAKVMLVSHITEIKSFATITEQLSGILGHTATWLPWEERDSIDKLFAVCPVLLLDNIRLQTGEEANDSAFAKELAQKFDLYVNDAFSVSHRAHASVHAITAQLPAYGGLLLEKEIRHLSAALTAPAQGKTIVLGGAKISTKLPVIKNFLDKADNILIGGALANNFFQARGIAIGASLVDDSIPAAINGPKIILPEDILVSADKSGRGKVETLPAQDIAPDQLILDIGPSTADRFSTIIKSSSLVIWNGPMGLAETPAFAQGTQIIAQAVAEVKHSIVGGGDTIATLDQLGILGKYTFVSSGGGAMLQFLSGKKLPGLEALGYY